MTNSSPYVCTNLDFTDLNDLLEIFKDFTVEKLQKFTEPWDDSTRQLPSPLEFKVPKIQKGPDSPYPSPASRFNLTKLALRDPSRSCAQAY